MKMKLTEDEVRVVEAYRAQQSVKAHRARFKTVCIDELKKWNDYSQETGAGLSFSLWMDVFGEDLTWPEGFAHEAVFRGMERMKNRLNDYALEFFKTA